MIEPTPPRPGEPLRASWAQRLVAYVRSLRVSAGPGLVARRTSAGTVVSLASSGPRRAPRATATAECCPAVVEMAYAAIPGTYRVILYPDGLGGRAGARALLCCTERGQELDLPSGTVVLAHAVALAAADDGEDAQ